MKNIDFSKNQIEGIKEFTKLTKKCINTKKLSPSFLLYIISSIPNSNNETVFTKSNKMVLRSFLPIKKRLHIEFILKEIEKL